MVKITRMIRRETSALDRKRPITVNIAPLYCSVGVKNSRQRFTVTWNAVYDLARKLDAREKLAARAARA